MKSLIWKRLLGKCYVKNSSKPRKLILLYHAVGDSSWAISLTKFSTQMRFLSKHCEVLTVTDLLTAKPSSKIQVAITFDDGYACLHDVAAPIMRELNILPMVYLNTGWVGETQLEQRDSDEQLGHYPNERFLTWVDVEKLSHCGWEFGSHGVNHLHFTQLARERAREELLNSKKMLEQRLKKPCIHFAYTWGEYSDSLKSIVSQVGYCYAASVDQGPLTLKSSNLALPRMNISNDYTLNDFKAIVAGKWDFIGKIQKIRRLL
jgi:peptidoglycan/xylan/chitin deacetylase (PgdA/CDA1 family)